MAVLARVDSEGLGLADEFLGRPCQDVQQIYSTASAFLALQSDGRLVTWGVQEFFLTM